MSVRVALGVVALLGAATPSAGTPKPTFMTLVVRLALPPPAQLAARSAVLRGTETIAEAHALYFRVNPNAPDAIDRKPHCLPGTRSSLYWEVAVLYSIDHAVRDTLVARVFVDSCSSARASLYGQARIPVVAAEVNETVLDSAVNGALTNLEGNIKNDPALARDLGLLN